VTPEVQKNELTSVIDGCRFYYFVLMLLLLLRRNILVALLEALCARIHFFRFVNLVFF